MTCNEILACLPLAWHSEAYTHVDTAASLLHRHSIYIYIYIGESGVSAEHARATKQILYNGELYGVPSNMFSP